MVLGDDQVPSNDGTGTAGHEVHEVQVRPLGKVSPLKRRVPLSQSCTGPNQACAGPNEACAGSKQLARMARLLVQLPSG